MAGDDGLTRRQFLIGGGTLAAVAAAGVALGSRSWRVRDAYYRLTGAYGEPGRIPPKLDAVTYEYGTLRSPRVKDPVEYGVAVPIARVPQGFTWPVCLCLPGRGRGPEGVLENGLRLADFAYAPSPQGGVPLYALVAVQAGDTYWHARADGDDAMAMLLDEFIPFIEDRLNGGRPAPMAVMGWSMGGYGALRAGEVRPGRFRAVCAVSPALWESFEEGVGDAFDDAADYDEHDVYAGAGVYDGAGVHPLLRVDCGRQDPFADAVRAFRAAVPAPPEGGFSPGGHDDGYWRRVAPAETAFVAAALAG